MKADARQNEILDRRLPSDPFAEAAVLGGILLNPELLDANDVRAVHFFEDRHRLVFAHLAKLRESATPIDTPHLVASLREDRDFERIGGAPAIAGIIEGNAIPSRFGEYLAKLHDLAARRDLFGLAFETLRDVHGDIRTSDLLSGVRDRLHAIEGTGRGGVRYNRITSSLLATTRYSVDFHVSGLLVKGQPQGIFGAKKSLKTNLVCDLAISVQTGEPFLGRFAVEHPGNVAFFSAESGLATLQETASRICESKGISLADTGVVFYDTVPVFGDLEHMDALRRSLVDDGIELAIFDPAYLAIRTEREGSLFAMGAILRSVSELCQELSITPLLVHHMRKSVADPYAPGDLDDASWAGFAEFCRGWLLINRREKYEPGTGMHRLWLSVGGSVGHSGLWGLDIFEGVYTGPGSRKWEVDVLKADEVRQGFEEEQSKAKQQKADAKLEQVKREIVGAMVKLPKHTGTLSEVRTATGRNGQLFSIAFGHLIQERHVHKIEITKGNNRTYEAYTLAEDSDV